MSLKKINVFEKHNSFCYKTTTTGAQRSQINTPTDSTCSVIGTMINWLQRSAHLFLEVHEIRFPYDGSYLWLCHQQNPIIARKSFLSLLPVIIIDWTRLYATIKSLKVKISIK